MFRLHTNDPLRGANKGEKLTIALYDPLAPPEHISYFLDGGNLRIVR